MQEIFLSFLAFLKNKYFSLLINVSLHPKFSFAISTDPQGAEQSQQRREVAGMEGGDRGKQEYLSNILLRNHHTDPPSLRTKGWSSLSHPLSLAFSLVSHRGCTEK